MLGKVTHGIKMATLQQVRLEAYGHRNAVDDFFAENVLVPSILPPADAASQLKDVVDILKSAGNAKKPVIIAAGPAAAACFASIEGKPAASAVVRYQTLVDISSRRIINASMLISIGQIAGTDSILVCTAAADETSVAGPWTTPADSACLSEIMSTLGSFATCFVALDVQITPKERFVGGDEADADAITVHGTAASLPGDASMATMPRSISCKLGSKTLTPVPLRELSPPLYFDNLLATVITAITTTTPELAALPAVALRTFAPASEFTSLDVGCAAIASAMVALASCSGQASAPLELPSTFGASYAAALRKLRASGLLSSHAMLAS